MTHQCLAHKVSEETALSFLIEILKNINNSQEKQRRKAPLPILRLTICGSGETLNTRVNEQNTGPRNKLPPP
jgi:hypothetical protein